MTKIISISFFTVALLMLLGTTAQAQQPVNVYFFNALGCPHCEKEELFLDRLTKENPAVKIYPFEVTKDAANAALLRRVGQELEEDVTGVPFTVIGDQAIIGYLNDETTGQEINRRVDYCSSASCPDLVGRILAEETAPPPVSNQTSNALPEKINLPIFGEVELKAISLPILTIMIGALDGFNPCAMWVLLFLISLLLGMENRTRMWILGAAFIIASGAVYFLFMVAWLNVLLFLGFVFWIRLIIASAALASGVYNLKEFWKNKDAACKVTQTEKRKKIFAKLKEIAQNKKFLMALGGIILLAGAVNLVELVCSAGFPAVYTNILSLSNLSPLEYYFYIFFYIFIFMLDDLLVFVIAMITLKATGLTAKYTRFSYLIGGVLMIILGILLIFKPAWLMFG